MSSFAKTRERWPSHRAIGKEQSCRDLPVRLALGDQCRDALLGRRECAGRGRPTADSLQLGACSLGPESGTDPLEDGERLLERLARLAAPLYPALCRTQREQGATSIERQLDLRVPLERLLVRLNRPLDARPT